MRKLIFTAFLLLTPSLIAFAAGIPIITISKATINYSNNQVTFSGSGFEPSKKSPTVLFAGTPGAVQFFQSRAGRTYQVFRNSRYRLRFLFASFRAQANLQLLEFTHKMAGWPSYGHLDNPSRAHLNRCASESSLTPLGNNKTKTIYALVQGQFLLANL